MQTEIVSDWARKTLHAIIRGKVEPESIIHSDTRRGYSKLVDLRYKKHYRVRHGNDQSTNGKRRINGFESFWSYSKRNHMKLHGKKRSIFYLHPKDWEFGCN